MAPLNTNVFFYGLFMDAAVLQAKGVHAPDGEVGVVRDWELRIGRRATLVPARGGSVHGVLMSLPLPDLDRLYAETSVQAYRPVAVIVESAHRPAVPAVTYVLPTAPAPDERNPEYAAKLRSLAERLSLPASYTQSIV